MTGEGLQPDLHDALICVRAPLMAVSAQDGQIRTGAHGYYLGDYRSLSALVLTIDGLEPTILTSQVCDASSARFFGYHAAVSGLADQASDQAAAQDPQFVVARERELGDGEIRERIRIRNTDDAPRRVKVAVEIGCEYADVDDVKAGRDGEAGTVHEVRPGILGWRRYRVAFTQESRRTPGTTVSTDPRPTGIDLGPRYEDQPTLGRFEWVVDLAAAAQWQVTLLITQPDPPRRFPFVRSALPASWANWTPTTAPVPTPAGRPTTRPIDRLLANSLADLDALRLAAGEQFEPNRLGLAQETFVAAGAPWYLTLFGRDSLWAARMVLPIDRELALGTLSMLSRYQGAKDDSHNDEQPGKILRELRSGTAYRRGAMNLPPVYYGSVDATLLFIILMAETWRHDKNDDSIRALVPSLRSALSWLERQSSEHSGGFVAHTPPRHAPPPIALCETQGYAYEAALGAADLLECLEAETDEANRWRQWAAQLKSRFHKAFWIEDAHGRYPASAVDGDLTPVNGPSSTIGHLLSGGILDRDETALVARVLLSPPMDSGRGIRTRSAASDGYNPFGYHRGSVWPHETAIIIRGLTDHDPAAAARLATDLLDASVSFGHRLPELYSGIGRDDSAQPVSVRAACLPQARSSAAAIVIAQALGVIGGPLVP